MRLGVEVLRNDITMCSWYHPACYNPSKKTVDRGVCEVCEIRGFHALSESDQQSLSDVWDDIKSGKRRTLRVAEVKTETAANKRAKTEKDEDAGVDQALLEKYKKMKIPELKGVLRANKQLLGGTKDELIARCVDGEMYGAIPKCPR